jgi:hypothetical protein
MQALRRRVGLSQTKIVNLLPRIEDNTIVG